jgi:hypothetical protein
MDEKQKAMLKVALSKAFGDYETLRRSICETCNFDLNQHTHATAGLETAYDVAINQAITKGQMENLVQNMASHTNPDTASIANALEQQLAKSRPRVFSHLQRQDPFSALFLGGEDCFIGRETLRNALREMQSGQGRRRVLVVNGNRSCGKTYTFDLLRQIDGFGDSNIVIKIDFRRFREGDLESRYQDIVEAINTRMKVPAEDMPKLFESQTRWFQNAIRKFEVVAQETRKQLWLVFDHFGVGEVEDKIADALASTAIYAIDEAKALFVVLIDVEPSTLKLEVPVARRLLNDAAALPERQDLVAFLKQARDISEKPEVSDAAIEDAVTAIMDSLQTYGESERAYEYSQLTCKRARQLGFLP